MIKASTFKRLMIAVAMIYYLGSLQAQSLLPQVQSPTEPLSADTIEDGPAAIPLTGINKAAAEAASLYSRIQETQMEDDFQKSLEERNDTLISRVQTFLRDSGLIQPDLLNIRELDKLNKQRMAMDARLQAAQEEVSSLLRELESGKEKLRRSRERWEVTRNDMSGREVPVTILNRISSVLNKNDSLTGVLDEDMAFVLRELDRVTDMQIRMDQVKTKLEAAGRLTGERIFRKDLPPLWKDFSKRADRLSLEQQWQELGRNFRGDTTELLENYRSRLWVSGLLFIILLILVYRIRRSTETRENVTTARGGIIYLEGIFHRPLAVSIILGLYAVRLLMPELPSTYRTLMAIVMAAPLITIAVGILPGYAKRYLFEFVSAYLLIRIFDLFYTQTILIRMVLLLTNLLAIVFTVRFLLRHNFFREERRKFLGYFLYSLAVLFFVFLVIALAGNIAGIYSLSEYLVTAVILSAFYVLTIHVGLHIAGSLLYLLLSGPLTRWSNIVTNQFSFIFSRLFGILRLLFWLSWVVRALDYFKVKTPFFTWGQAFLGRELTIGQASFTLVSILLFFFVIWLSMFISRIVRHILQEEVFARIEIERGMPGTIVMLIRIALISVGFLVAAAAAGMELTNLTIIIGAFSVGIGFGLQNIFNNLVSGLILAFERPIKEGDTVEVNQLLGIVKKIGIRSSVVRTYDGAEVIVPNGELISNNMINWTLSDAQRRMDIRVGVAYGTDPERVLDILLEAAKAQEHVNRDPEPRAYFIGFGESSLDFRLLAWIDLDYRLETESALRVEINRLIKEAGIEIPFPQRDLHVRSVKEQIIKGFTDQDKKET